MRLPALIGLGSAHDRTGSLERLRAANSRAIITLLAGEGPMSRADLARGTGLSRTTVSSLVTALIGTGQVAETTAAASRTRAAADGRRCW